MEPDTIEELRAEIARLRRGIRALAEYADDRVHDRTHRCEVCGTAQEWRRDYYRGCVHPCIECGGRHTLRSRNGDDWPDTATIADRIIAGDWPNAGVK